MEIYNKGGGGRGQLASEMASWLGRAGAGCSVGEAKPGLVGGCSSPDPHFGPCPVMGKRDQPSLSSPGSI